MKETVLPRKHVEIGARVRDLRIAKKIRQVDLAASAGLSSRHLIRIEQGEGGESKPETLDGLARALGVERSELDGDEDDEESDQAVPVRVTVAIDYDLLAQAMAARDRARVAVEV